MWVHFVRLRTFLYSFIHIFHLSLHRIYHCYVIKGSFVFSALSYLLSLSLFLMSIRSECIYLLFALYPVGFSISFTLPLFFFPFCLSHSYHIYPCGLLLGVPVPFMFCTEACLSTAMYIAYVTCLRVVLVLCVSSTLIPIQLIESTCSVFTPFLRSH